MAHSHGALTFSKFIYQPSQNNPEYKHAKANFKKEFQPSMQSFLAESPYMSALTKFVNIVNTVRPPSLMVFFVVTAL